MNRKLPPLVLSALVCLAGAVRAETGLPPAAQPAAAPAAQPAPSETAPATAAAPVNPAPPAATPTATAQPAAEATPAPAAVAPTAAPQTPLGTALKSRLASIPDGDDDEQKAERAAIVAHYESHPDAPLWIEAKGFNAPARAVVAEFAKAGEWGLEPSDFAAPSLATGRDLTPDEQADAEIALTREVLKYARYARGGRIMNPSEQLNSNLDRKPQLLDPAKVLEGLAAAPDKASYLVGTHPQHPQFQRLREKYVEAIAKTGGKPNAAAKRILANMEMWRWMHDDLGELYLMANIPAYMIEIVKDGKTIHSERIVVGEIGKQTSVFTRSLKSITFNPMWRVPESIKVNELWPSLLRGGGLMRQYGLEVETKDGKRLDWRTMDWRNLDIRNYEVVQPAGRKSVMGYVKFSFPSQHTIFMHDTPDKWMFTAKQRTLSHGCLRLRNPLEVAKVILAEDKGWEPAKIDNLAKNGPMNNEIEMEKRIRMHLAYFTVWVDDAGAVKTYSDIYGHEKRVTQALDGKWQQIAKGRDHLAPAVPDQAHLEAKPVKQASGSSKGTANEDFLGSFFGGFSN